MEQRLVPFTWILSFSSSLALQVCETIVRKVSDGVVAVMRVIENGVMKMVSVVVQVGDICLAPALCFLCLQASSLACSLACKPVALFISHRVGVHALIS